MSAWSRVASRFLPPAVALLSAALVVSVVKLQERRSQGALAGAIAPDEFRSIAATGHRTGPVTAPVTVVIYFDYGCEYCARFHEGLDSVMSVRPGAVATLMKVFVPPVVGWPFATALAGECAASQGRFEAFRDSAYANPRLSSSPEGWRRLGILAQVPDARALAACVTERRFESVVRANYDEGKRLGIPGTPYILVNGRAFRGAVPRERLEAVILEEERRAR